MSKKETSTYNCGLKEPNALQKRILAKTGGNILQSYSAGAINPIDPTPSDIGDYLRVCPVDPITHVRSSFIAFIEDPAVAAIASKYLGDQGAVDFFGSLSEEDRLQHMPSRYDQGYAILDQYSDYLNNTLIGVLNNKEE